MGNITKDLGAVSAYALAVEKGYTGTEEEFAVLLATSAQNAQSAAESAAAAKKSEEAAARSEENVHDYITDINNAGSAQVSAVNAAGAAQQSAIEQKGAATLETIPADYTALAQDVSALKDTKADCITDTSAKAVAHELHAQSGPMSVTLYGKTTETGTGEKSPTNPYAIGGVDSASIRAGSKNLFDPSKTPYLNRTELNVSGDDIILTCTSTFDYTYARWDIMENPVPGTNMMISASAMNTVGGNKPLMLLRLTENGASVSNVSTGNAGAIKYTVPEYTGHGVLQVILYSNSDGVPEVGATCTYKNVQVEIGSVATPYVPYNANVIDMPLLPDGDPLMEGDTIENDVLSGCDVAITFDGSDDEQWMLASSGPWAYTQKEIPNPANNMTSLVGHCYADKLLAVDLQTVISGKQDGIAAAMQSSALRRVAVSFAGVTTLEGFKAKLAENPVTVFYRSTEYTPEKDLRVCRVTRKRRKNLLLSTGSLGGIHSNGSSVTHVWFEKHPDAVYSGKYVVSDLICSMLKRDNSWTTPDSADRIYTINTGVIGNNYVIGLPAGTTIEAARDMLANCEVEYALKNPEVYMTDYYDLRKPYGLMPVSVTGSGETAVEYPHQTKHYIDSKISELVTLALANS